MPQIILAAPTMMRAHIRATSSTRSGATRRTNKPGTSAMMKVTVKKNTLNKVERTMVIRRGRRDRQRLTQGKHGCQSDGGGEEFDVFLGDQPQSRRGPALRGRRPDRDRIQGRVRQHAAQFEQRPRHMIECRDDQQ